MDVQDQWHPAKPGEERRGGQQVGHVVGLDEIEAQPGIQSAQSPGGPGHEPPIPAHIGERPSAGLLVSHGVNLDRARAHLQAFGLADADQVDLVATLGQRTRLALDP